MSAAPLRGFEIRGKRQIEVDHGREIGRGVVHHAPLGDALVAERGVVTIQTQGAEGLADPTVKAPSA
ncbi:hypothetical protein CQ035_01720 [Brevundimonas sp. MYb46]|nr:hypothetical protein CQ024_11420 [Brevundimonas sp. MYb27]PRB38145.1 hypothetical protein CQ035_01720 [Brevundimonas sp. MYb46]PRB56073.1 hypothetical protein CQ028_01210 [Brevundimonas sp. MYb33]